jgi:YggT family protein
MFIIGNFLIALATILNYVLQLYMYVIIIRAILSWINPDPYNPIVRFIYSITDPVLYAIRRRLPVFFGGIDFSPWVVVLAILFLQKFLVPSLFEMGMLVGR